ncbi:phosphatase [Marinilabilia salmonicolor]|jgi:exopolyphosphatase/guanosine-5'-triphosphate,3'-diphosphate pyrophosphatase|uniref:Exopolyphosphatase/guanosine-5'-triphosphate, 3'-diphosphate pyrophosphatase n=1 Tax=Marinilabilia salmonicolor TaxID=989 RepID=A0A2T0XT15_9BACT|nr:phosphatase [Marinilabilia salmonicolor]PRZ02094.1 exopolyphosphatase/guanosine-5'-triphosphate,3'-diphosphate pyrophosphatase [Marinilabilia salmonicolor]RCW36049.1 exopolyphosphatase/guanosine-5'-triphosphate,3'-diphosphate pyrophosphatase [Marinilabilia salmonicolor]
MKHNRIAIIDLGTNTFNLLITEVAENGTYNILLESKNPAKLGKGGIHKATITSEAMERGIEALKSHLITISDYQVESIFCFATSAIRSANNGQEFVKRVKNELGLTIRIIQGDEEAQTIFDGVRQVYPLDEEYILIMDIGGGSIEFIIANRFGVAWKQSFELGVARLLEQFTPSDPIKEAEIKVIQKHLKKELEMLFEAVKQFPVKKMVGSSGSFDTLAALLSRKFYPLLDISKLTSLFLEPKRLMLVHKELMASNSDERKVMPGMEPHRVDSIVPASIIVKFITEELKIKEIWQCSFALKEGAILQIISSQL